MSEYPDLIDIYDMVCLYEKNDCNDVQYGSMPIASSENTNKLRLYIIV